MEIHNYIVEGGSPSSNSKGLNGLTDTNTPISPGAEIKSFMPEKANPYQSIILVPGFGHTVNTVGKSFTQLGESIARSTKIATYLTVDDQRDVGTKLFWTFSPASVSIAIESSINVSGKPAHVVAFSRHSQPAINAVVSMLNHQEGMLKTKFYSDWEKHKRNFGPILSLTLCAPAFWNNLRDLMEKRGSYTETADVNGPFIEIGKRKTKAMIHNSDYKEWRPGEEDLEEFRKSGELLTDRGIRCQVLIAKNDPVVPNEISVEVASAYGFGYQIIDPSPDGGAVHDFDDTKLQSSLVLTILKNLIMKKREFDIMPELQPVIRVI